MTRRRMATFSEPFCSSVLGDEIMFRKKYASSATTRKNVVAISPAHHDCIRNKSPFARRYCYDSSTSHRILFKRRYQGQSGRATPDVEARKGKAHNSFPVVRFSRLRSHEIEGYLPSPFLQALIGLLNRSCSVLLLGWSHVSVARGNGIKDRV